MSSAYDRVVLVVLDSVGCGAARDAVRFGDEKAHTLKHISEWAALNGFAFELPNLARWGLGQIYSGFGIPRTPRPQASTAILSELSPGKDTTTGHWEMAGTVLRAEFPVYPEGFAKKLLDDWCAENSLPGWLCNKPASGTTVIDEYGEEHLRTGKPIVYTSGDSVLQIAWSEEAFGIEKLYAISKSARKYVDPLGVGRVIARPFVGRKPGEFKRTENRRDYSVPPPAPNLLDLLVEEGAFVAGVGKIEDIFAHRSVTHVEHTGRNETSLEATLDFVKKSPGPRGLIFTNLIDFDQLHGHRRNPKTYAEALMAFDRFLPRLEAACGPRDLLVLTADHGNDPTHAGTDHTREDVPLLFWSKNPAFRAKELGRREGFATVARLTLDALGLERALAKLPDAAAATRVLD